MRYDSLFCFFFQAEDGIRDYKVTGVQTCALPISLRGAAAPARAGRRVSPDASGAPARAAARVPGRGADEGDRKSVAEGKRVDLGGRRIIKKKKRENRQSSQPEPRRICCWLHPLIP